MTNYKISKAVLTILFVLTISVVPSLGGFQFDIQGPVGSSAFGTQVVVLPNGNIVVTDPSFDAPGPVADVGAVYLYSGATGTLISTLTGTIANDQVGSGGVTLLTNGNFVVSSPLWDGTQFNAGAITWGSSTTGISGEVSATNSLVGSSPFDFVDNSGVTALTNGNYVVRNPQWDGTANNVGAVTWGNGTTGTSGTVSATNSLVGSTAGDQVGRGNQFGSGGVRALTNGNYIVNTTFWNESLGVRVGAVTWGSGTTGISGEVSGTNSLVGSTAGDLVGGFGVTVLPNGNYVVSSPDWTTPGGVMFVGAVTWGNGTTGISGEVSATNSLVGSTANDRVGRDGVTALTNGNYVVRSLPWTGTSGGFSAITWGSGTTGISGEVSATNSLVGTRVVDQVGGMGITVLTNGNYVVLSPRWSGTAAEAGAVTWGNGTTGTSGEVSVTNSLVGTSQSDNVGNRVTALTNGNYVVNSTAWSISGVLSAVGAVTWGNGTTGISGEVSAKNSLVGSTRSDGVGSQGVTALTNGNYVVSSPFWDGTAVNVGAVTWGNGTTGISGTVSVANSLVGSTISDQVGIGGATALTNGNYAVGSRLWDGTAADVGAITFGNGTSGIAGAVSVTNSLFGSTESDQVGSQGVTALANGNYVVRSQGWDGTAVDVGAVSFVNGTTGIAGTVSATNSLVGSTINDQVGNGGVTALNNGNYVVISRAWDNGGTADAGAATHGVGTIGTTGTILSSNSVRGMTTNAGSNLGSDFDPVYNQLVIGRSIENIVSLFRLPSPMAAPFDFDGDGRTDISVFRGSEGNWYIGQSTDGFLAINHGLADDELTPADYDGDGQSDFAVWRPDAPTVSAYYILHSSNYTLRVETFGQTGDDSIVVGDWDGDGKADPAVYRDSASGSQSRFYYLGSDNNPGNNITFLNWGTTGDEPLKGDFDGDGKLDLAVFRPSDLIWYIQSSSDSSVRYETFGFASDRRLNGDFDGDGKTDLAVFRPSENNWYWLESSTNEAVKFPFGLSSDQLTPGDYDGDGKTDPAIFRNGIWYISETSSGNTTIQNFGIANDTAIPSSFVGND